MLAELFYLSALVMVFNLSNLFNFVKTL